MHDIALFSSCCWLDEKVYSSLLCIALLEGGKGGGCQLRYPFFFILFIFWSAALYGCCVCMGEGSSQGGLFV